LECASLPRFLPVDLSHHAAAAACRGRRRKWGKAACGPGIDVFQRSPVNRVLDVRWREDRQGTVGPL